MIPDIVDSETNEELPDIVDRETDDEVVEDNGHKANQDNEHGGSENHANQGTALLPYAVQGEMILKAILTYTTRSEYRAVKCHKQ